jgi:hypothetical protein
MSLTTNGGRVLLTAVTAFATMAGFLFGYWLGSLVFRVPLDQPNWIALGLGVAACSVAAMVGAGWVEYVRRAPHLQRVMATAGLSAVLFSLPVLAIVPGSYAFIALAAVVAGMTVWVDIRRSRATDWDG